MNGLPNQAFDYNDDGSVRDDSYPLPRSRGYKLYELDGTNVRLITGLSYNQLRVLASMLNNPNYEGKETMNAPYWFKVLETSADELWDWRVKHGMDTDIAAFWES